MMLLGGLSKAKVLLKNLRRQSFHGILTRSCCAGTKNWKSFVKISRDSDRVLKMRFKSSWQLGKNTSRDRILLIWKKLIRKYRPILTQSRNLMIRSKIFKWKEINASKNSTLSYHNTSKRKVKPAICLVLIEWNWTRSQMISTTWFRSTVNISQELDFSWSNSRESPPIGKTSQPNMAHWRRLSLENQILSWSNLQTMESTASMDRMAREIKTRIKSTINSKMPWTDRGLVFQSLS